MIPNIIIDNIGINATKATSPKTSNNGLLLSIASDIEIIIERRTDAIIGPVTTPPASIASAKNKGLVNLAKTNTSKYPGTIKYNKGILVYIRIIEKTWKKQHQFERNNNTSFFL